MQVNESSVDHVINTVKTWLDSNPIWIKKGNIYVIDLLVRNGENLELRFHASKTEAAIPLPNFAYLFDNVRIRGLDFHSAYTDYAGNKNYGWHEHRWDDKNRDQNKYPNADFQYVPTNRQIDYVLKHWNIEYTEQLLLELQ